MMRRQWPKNCSAVSMQNLASSTPGNYPLLAPIPVPCKICAGPSPLLGVVDFHKSCIETQGYHLPLSGCPIYYRQCETCHFAFTDAFDEWSAEAFQANIYNDSYISVDPDLVEVRPAGNARLIGATFQPTRTSMRILDYGGGTGLFAERLREQGYSAATYDPFLDCHPIPDERFDLITCFEVMEHAPFPRETIAAIVGLMKEEGAVLFSTLLQPASFNKTGLQWWYASPRNGHVSLFSPQSLALLFQLHGMKVASFTEGLHIAYRTIPAFAKHLRLPE